MLVSYELDTMLFLLQNMFSFRFSLLHLWVYVYGLSLISFVLNTCVNMPHHSSVNCVRFRPRHLPGDDSTPVAVTSCVDGNFKLWSLSVDSHVVGQFSDLMYVYM